MLTLVCNTFLKIDLLIIRDRLINKKNYIFVVILKENLTSSNLINIRMECCLNLCHSNQ